MRSRIAEYAIAKSFLTDCVKLGYQTHWIECTSYKEGIEKYRAEQSIENIILMRPSEEYLARRIESWELDLEILPNTQFLITREEYSKQFEKPPVMETFYRYMRKSRNILMEDDGKPVGGKWNYDHENRNFDKTHVPSWSWKPSDTIYIDEAKKYFDAPDIQFSLPVSRGDALELLQYFLEYHSHDFGRLEDAMYEADALVHHSYISVAMNF
jgi:deoxyribodipyrimidine photolyase-related protein